MNQIEINPFLYRQQTIDYFRKQGVLLQSYRSLCNGKQFTNPILIGIANSYGKTVAQVLGTTTIEIVDNIYYMI